MATTRDLLTGALRELGVIDLTDAAPPAELTALALSLVNRILDDWNADRGAVYANVHSALVPFAAGVNPHSIGASGSPTWAVSGHRPVSIEGIRVTTDGGQTYLPPLTPRDADWWHALAAPGVQSPYPTDYYYDPTWPLGAIYFYPTPAAGAMAQLYYRIVLAQLALDDTVSYPPGYASALIETLKERLVELPMFASAATPAIKETAVRARARAFGNNAPVPALVTADAGMTTGGVGVYDHALGPYSLMRRS